MSLRSPQIGFLNIVVLGRLTELMRQPRNLLKRCESREIWANVAWRSGIPKNPSYIVSVPCGLWAQTGNFYHAIVLGEELLASNALPENLRHRILTYTITLRTRRAQWYEELAREIERNAA